MGAAAMDDNTEAGGGEAGSSGHEASFDDWPDDDEVEVAPHRQPAPDHQGAGSSVVPAARGSAQKRRAASTFFGSRPKKSKASTAATKWDEAVVKASRFCKAVKQPQAISA